MATSTKQSPKESDGKTLPFNAEISKVLKLVIHSLYTNKDIFLRELISNASDACEKLRYLALTNNDIAKESTELKITIAANEKAKTLIISDNGVGMNYDDLVNNLGTIAKSGTEQFFDELTGDAKKDASLIGQFGVGFYSAFMVADSVEVITRKAGEDTGYHWQSSGEGEFSITPIEGDTPRGTSIKLNLRKDAEEYLDKFKLQHIIGVYSDHISFPIEYRGEEDEAAEVINEGSALWVRNKSEISEDQYREFYHHVGHTADEPFLTMHNQVEGKLSYTNLLFIPTIRPFDLFHPDRRRRVKLYVKRVFITDENIDLIPHYLRFLRGIIDSEDLPLNISRETLQDNPMLAQIRESITKRVLTELKRKAQKDPEEYKTFWANFGSVLKEGLCDSIYNKEPLLEVCRFTSTHDDTALTSLDDYISRMDEKQENIYYITGDRVDALRKSPQLEGFAKNNIEVLLLNDHVDDFWVTVVSDFKGKKFKNVLNSGSELEQLSGEKSDDNNEESVDEKPSQKIDIANLVTAFKELFGDEVQDVRTTAKLTESPVCLAVDEGMMSMRMERFLIEHKQLPGASARILEINSEHPIIIGLSKALESGKKPQDIEDTARLLLDQARIIEGEELSDPSGFTQRINALIARNYAA